MKMGIIEKIIKIIIGALLIVILAIIIYYRKYFDLGGNPLDYYNVLLNCYAMFEIYTAVGFFMIQVIMDYRLKRNKKLIERYYRISKIKIIEKTSKYLGIIKDTYETLKKDAPIFENNNRSGYHKYLQGIYNQAKEKVILYKLKGEINSQSYNNNGVNINTNDTNYNAEKEINFNTKIKEVIQLKKLNQNNAINQQNLNNNQLKNQKTELLENSETSIKIRKFKKSLRRIIKLKKLNNEIELLKKESPKEENKKKCNYLFLFLFVAYVMAVITDFILPIAINADDDFTKYDDNFEKENSVVELILGIIASLLLAAICSAYTIIMIYSTKRRRYITGDFLYDKQINDTLSLIKTVQIVCGYSFSLIYCNLYLWKNLDKNKNYGEPKYYEETLIPDYTFGRGISIFMIVKIVIITISIIGTLAFSNFYCFQNDLAEYNLSRDGGEYDKDDKLQKVLADNIKAVEVLENPLLN